MQNDVCINCGKKATHYHHVVPKVLGGNDTTNVVPLCDNCHSLIHNISYSNGIISHSELTKIGLQKAKNNGKKLGQSKGAKLITKKSIEAKNIIKKYNIDFDGEMSDKETIKLANISRNSFYKYKKELRESGQ